jgi:hypothetical protein
MDQESLSQLVDMAVVNTTTTNTTQEIHTVGQKRNMAVRRDELRCLVSQSFAMLLPGGILE